LDLSPGSSELFVSTGICFEKTLAVIARSLLKAIAYLHERNMVHLDIKPANVLINSKGEIKLSDFGLARQFEKAGEQFASTFVGSIQYMSPQRLKGLEYSFPSDIFSFALTMLAVTMGRYPEELFFETASTPRSSLNSFGSSAFEEHGDTKGSVAYWRLLERWNTGKNVEIPFRVLHRSLDQNTGGIRSQIVTFSDQYRDFVSCALDLDPAQRLTAEQLLKHEWLSRFPEEESDNLLGGQQWIQSQEMSRLLLKEISSCMLNKARTEKSVCRILRGEMAKRKDQGAPELALEIAESQVSTLASELLLPSEVVKRVLQVTAASLNVTITLSDGSEKENN
jgi:serine/threonine protein kinase